MHRLSHLLSKNSLTAVVAVSAAAALLQPSSSAGTFRSAGGSHEKQAPMYALPAGSKSRCSLLTASSRHRRCPSDKMSPFGFIFGHATCAPPSISATGSSTNPTSTTPGSPETLGSGTNYTKSNFGLDLDEQNNKYFRIYTADGVPSSVSEMLATMMDSDLVLLGECHDDPVAHELERLLFILAHRNKSGSQDGKGRRVVLSLEMLESDVQHVVDEYLSDTIRPQDFLMDIRPWNNFSKDYGPIVEYCKKHGLPIIAANAPRRYVSLIGRVGPGGLPQTAASFLPPLPLPQPSGQYVAHVLGWIREEEAEALRKQKAVSQSSSSASTPAYHSTSPSSSSQSSQSSSSAPSHFLSSSGGTTSMIATSREASPSLTPTFIPAGGTGTGAAADDYEEAACPYIGLKSEDSLLWPLVLWDATMAYRLLPALQDNALVIHICGSFHCEKHLGILAERVS